MSAADPAAARAAAYRLLAAGFRWPSAELHAAVADGTYAGDLAAALAAAPWAVDPPALGAPTDLAAMEADHLACFELGGPLGAPCFAYEAEHGGGRLKVMEDVLRFYDHFGLAPAARDGHRDRPDHVATELEFLHVLACDEAAAAAAGRDPAPYRLGARGFLRLHVGDLAAAMSSRIGPRAVPFYAALCRLAAAVCAADLAHLGHPAPPPAPGRAPAGPDLVGLERRRGAGPPAPWDLVDMRRKPIPWDNVTRVSHDLNCGQNLTCSLAAFAWNGVVLREEQSGTYDPPNDPDVPDCNPRGCQKGIAYTHRMYDPQRVKYPMRRVGERGGGRWERVSWDEVLTDVADGVLDTIVAHGPKTVVNAGGTHGETAGGVDWGRLATGLGIPIPLVNTEIGDDHQGALEMLGNSSVGSSADDWYHADMIVIWCGNPAYSQITWHHYFTEARYNGTKVVAITPEYSPSCIQVDEWIPVRPGSDAAFGLAVAQVIVEEGLYDEAFVKEQTDLPLLVGEDGKYLAEADVVADGRDWVFYLWDAATGLTTAPHRVLVLGGLDPVLDGEWEVGTLAGPKRVRTVFRMLREHLDASYRPEQAAEVCGTNPETIRRFAREFAAAEGVVNAVTYNPGRFYHGNLMERAMLYNWALCGHLGRKGANFNAQCALFVRESTRGVEAAMRQMVESARYHPDWPRWEERGFSEYRILKEVFSTVGGRFMQPSSHLYFFHGGLLEMSEAANSWDPYLTRPLHEFVDEALAGGTRHVYPAPGTDPKAMFVWGGDPVRRGRANQRVLDTLWPKLDLVVTVDWRWSGSARNSDYVLPACGLYERTSGRLLAGFWQPVGHFTFKATEPLYESRSDFRIFTDLVARIGERARERGITTVVDPETGAVYSVDALDQNLPDAGGAGSEDAGGIDAGEAFTRDAYEHTRNIEQLPWEDVKRRGWVHFTDPGLVLPYSADFAGDLEPGEPAVPLTRHVVDKEPYNTRTGRISFYVDHDWYLELGEALACHKDPPRAGGDFPIVLGGTHARWSIHTSFAEDALMLALQRGEPVVYVGEDDAAGRGIADGDTVEVFNDVGRFEAKALLTPRLPPGHAMITHAWTNAQFADGRHFQQVMPSPFNPIEFAPVTFAEYPNLASDGWAGDVGCNDRETRVEIRRVARG